jgi:hypothetical protein
MIRIAIGIAIGIGVCVIARPAWHLIDDIYTAFVCGMDDPARYED